ncbi:hypothetical protein D9619_012190 [Psilocybe cf. subviscida]|uniref:C3H1-type domain-containing protein n=1 Tax=Psilocybe cf. subviscida TaxID=2480587 RepID=A0A8H5EZN7_9AGAR|nr:hypothetical protein D9619_012190 [Psilocybe cf. subviscida]
MDSDIQQRRAIRAENARKTAEKAEAVRLKGNEFFKQGDYLSAGAQYMEAIDVQGPRPVLLSNLAACFNKIPCHEAAEEIATRALEYDPRSVKIRYRRVIARKNLSFFAAALHDLEGILAQDPGNPEAQRELAQMSLIQDAGYPTDKDDDGWPWFNEEPYEFAEDSDTEDCKHKPHRPPCRFYNRGTCDRGASCRFSHAPDAISVRDELGRNVCSRYLMGQCGSNETKCVYSHSRAHLPANGWWNSPEAIEAARFLKDIVEDDDVGYDDLFEAVRMYPKGHGYTARRRRELLTKWLHMQFGNTVAETFLYAGEELPAPPKGPFILVVDFDYEGVMDFLHRDLFSAMAAKIKVVHVRASSNGRGGDMAVQHLTSAHLSGVLVTDEQAICNPAYHEVAQKLVEYAKGGGTVVLGGKIANELRANVFDRVMMTMWGLDWKYGSYFRTTFSKNPDNAVVKANPSLLPSYSMKALHVAEIDLRDAVYVQTTESHLQSLVFPPVDVRKISKRDEAPAVLSKVGKGYLGFVGDVNVESGSIELTMAMLGMLKPKRTARAATATAVSSATVVDPVEEDHAEGGSALPSKISDKYVIVLELNRHHATAIANPNLPEEYDCSAHNLQGFHFEDLLYEGGSPTRVESPILRARVGKGYVGYMGDINPEPESTMVILSMFELLNPPRELVRDEEKFMLFISAYSKDRLGPHADGFLNDVEGRVKVIVGLGDLSKPRVVDLLASPDLVGVFVGDAAVLIPENAYFLSQLVKYSKNGGTLVFGWLFPEVVTLTQFRPLFRDNWGLDWDIVRAFDAKVVPNPKNRLINRQNLDKLPKMFDYQGIYVKSISESAAVYYPQKMKPLWNPSENVYMSSLLFTEVEKGKLGYIGSSSLDGECRTIIYAMMGIL